MITREFTSHLGKSIAVFSDCERYRYKLTRSWGVGPNWLYIMLNPSTVTEATNDPTVERCQRRAVMGDAGSFTVCNLFAWRSTDPKQLMVCEDPIGPDNDLMISNALEYAQHVICGWGANRAIGERGRRVLALIREMDHKPQALRINKDGSPGHPLYIGYGTQPMVMP
jgi:hypothetical protein